MIITALCNGTNHDLSRLDIGDIEPWAIAKSLSNINRFNGHAGAYSVAQHCVLVASQLPPRLRLSGLLHDAHESLIGDISSPVKSLIGGDRLREIEDALLCSIDERFGTTTRHALVREADLRALVTEGGQLGLSLDYFPDVEPFGCSIKVWPARQAADMWLDYFHTYRRTRG